MENVNLIHILDFIDNLADSFAGLRDDQKTYALICLVNAESILDKGRTFILADQEQREEVRQRLDKSRSKIADVLKSFDQSTAKEILEGAGQSLLIWAK